MEKSTNIKQLVNEAHLVTAYDITEEDVKNAASYIPTVMKMAFVGYVAKRCFDTLDISTDNGNGVTNALPSRYKVNTDKKSRYLMAALVGMYLGKDYEREESGKEDGDVWLMSVREYDMYAGGHIFETLNRMKSNTVIRDKCFDILSDYSELKYRLDMEIKGFLDALNDGASRLLAYVESASSPETMKQTMEQLSQNQQLFDEFMAEHKQDVEEVPEEKTDGN